MTKWGKLHACVKLVRSSCAKPCPAADRARHVSDMKIGEIAYTVPWALDLSDFSIVKESQGTAEMGVKRLGEFEYEVWME